jgi:hypothetical protein
MCVCWESCEVMIGILGYKKYLLPTWVATHPCVVRRSKPYELILACFPSRIHNSAVQKWFQIFVLIFFGKSQLRNKKVDEKNPFVS